MSSPLWVLRGAPLLLLILFVTMLGGCCWSRTGRVQAFGGRHVPTTTACSPASVYINLPFCRRRCFYCDFPIKVSPRPLFSTKTDSTVQYNSVPAMIDHVSVLRASISTVSRKTCKAQRDRHGQVNVVDEIVPTIELSGSLLIATLF